LNTRDAKKLKKAKTKNEVIPQAELSTDDGKRQPTPAINSQHSTPNNQEPETVTERRTKDNRQTTLYNRWPDNQQKNNHRRQIHPTDKTNSRQQVQEFFNFDRN
jgi:hypothetical protein